MSESTVIPRNLGEGRLWIQLITVALIATVIVLLVSAGTHYQLYASFSEKEFEKEGDALVGVVAASVLEPIIAEDRAELETVVTVLSRGTRSLASVIVFNEDDSVLASWIRKSEGGEFAVFSRDVTLAGESFGRVVLEMDPKFHQLAYRRNFLNLLLSLAFGVMAVVAVMVVFVHFWVVRPVQRMSGRLYVAGNFPQRKKHYFRRFSNELSVLQQAVSLNVVHMRSSRRRHAELRLAQERAEAGSRAKTRFLSTMSHELQTPLSAIMGAVRLLQTSQLDGPSSELAARAERAAGALLKMVRDIIDFASLDIADDAPDTSAFSPASHLQNVREMFLLEASTRDVPIMIALDPEVPDLVTGSAARVQQVLVTLVSNAVKFTPAGEIRLSVSLLSKQDSAIRLCFTVADTGVGFSDTDRARMFEGFTQLDADYDREYGGSGLGLALASRWLRSMGSELQCHAEAGSGSRFWFELDLTLETETKQAVAEEPASGVLQEEIRGKRVLLVDDSDSNRMVAAAMLEALGVVVIEAGSGEEAIRVVAGQSLDLVLMDLQMPGMDGWEATRRIRSLGGIESKVPVVALSANNSEYDREHSAEVGMNSFLSKPPSPEALKNILCHWAAESHASQAGFSAEPHD